MTIVTEELNFDGKHQSYIQDHGRTCATNSFIPGQGGNFTASRGNISSSQQERSINFSAYREGMLIAYDWRNSKILYSNIEEIFGADANTDESAITAFRDVNIPPSSQLQSHGGRNDKGRGPTVGVKHVQTLLSYDRNAGLDYFFTRTCLDPDVNALTGRSGWLNWVCATSPILARCLELAHKYVLQDKERTVVYDTMETALSFPFYVTLASMRFSHLCQNNSTSLRPLSAQTNLVSLGSCLQL